MSKYHCQSVEIIVDKDDPLWEKLVARAEATGMTVEAVIESLIFIGSYGLMADRLKLLEELGNE